MFIPAQLLLLHTSLQLQLLCICCVCWKNNAAFNIGLNSSTRRRPTNSGSSLFVSSSSFHNRRTSVSPTVAVTQTMRRRRRRLYTNNAIDKHNKAYDLYGVFLHSYCCYAHTTTADMNDEIASTLNYSSLSFKVGIVGAGAVAYGTASLLSSLNHDAMLWSPSSSSSSTIDEDSNSRTLQSTGAILHSFTVRTTTSPRELISSNDGILLLALPANGHKSVMETLSPYIIDHLLSSNSNVMKDVDDNGVNKHSNDDDGIAVMHIIISSHASLGAVYFLQILRNECHRRVAMQMQSARQCGVHDNNIEDTATMAQVVNTIMKRIKITAWGTTVVTARKVSNTIAHIPSVRTVVDYCTVPTSPPPSSTTTTTTTTTITTSSIDSTTPSVTTKIKTTTKQEILMNDDGYNLCTILFSSQQQQIHFQKRVGGLLAITLSNLNPQNHLGIVLGNMSRMDIAPVPPPPMYTTTKSTIPNEDDKIIPSSSPWYQCANVTPNIGRLMEALDVERLDIAQAFDINVRTIHEHYSWSFGIPMKTPIDNGGDDESTSTISEDTTATTTMRDLSISEMNQQMHHYLHNDVLGPTTPNTRYVIEDVPYGLVTTVLLGRLVDKIALLHESGIHIISAMYGRDFMIENDLLYGLGLLSPSGKTDGIAEKNVPSLESWKRMAYSGSFSEHS